MSFPADQSDEQPPQPPDPAPVAASVVRFCRDCGRPWESDWLECPHCGATNVAGAQFCESCGKALPSLYPTGPRVVSADALPQTALGHQLVGGELAKTQKNASTALLVVAIIGVFGDDPETFEQHYYDSRGVARVYRMSVDGNVWKIWREAPGFWQRYNGTIAEDGARIEGAWEKSGDGSEWEHDFVLNYVRV